MKRSRDRSSIGILSTVDWPVFLVTLILLFFGGFFAFSGSVDIYGEIISTRWLRQIIWISISLFVIVGCLMIPYVLFNEFGIILYGVALLGLVATLLFGDVINGTRAWLQVGTISFQFSELGKIGFILVLAQFLEKNKNSINSFSVLGRSLGILSLPLALILLQPDLGTAVVYLFIFFIMLSMAGLNGQFIILFLSFIGCFLLFFLLPLSSAETQQSTSLNFARILGEWKYMQVTFYSLALIFILSLVTNYYKRNRLLLQAMYTSLILLLSLSLSFLTKSALKEYQLNRILVTLNPQLDPYGVGWNVIQSVTAIGSGGLVGKGFLQGTQSHLNYIPEQSTDFVISLVLEEIGFLGGAFILLLYGVLLFRFLKFAMVAPSRWSFIYTGIAAYFFIHLFINIGMNVGIFPVIGIPLLFLSYGGSAMVAAAMAIGIFARLYREQFKE